MSKKRKPTNLNNPVETDKPEIFWAVPMGETLNVDAFRSLLGVAQVCGAYRYTNIPVQRMRTDLARNSIIKTFLNAAKKPNDVLVMLDNDHVHPPTVVRDLATVGDQFGVVAALAYRRGEPYDPVMFVRTPEDGKLHPIAQWPQNAFIECDMVGHGAIAIKRWVFDKLTEMGRGAPFYRYQYREDGTAPSEDMYFGESCEAAGIKHFCRTDVVIPHITNYFIDGSDWQKWVDQHPADVKQLQKMPKISVIIPSLWRPEQLQKCLDRLFETTQGHDLEVIVVTDKKLDDQRVTWIEGMYTAIQGWNIGAAAAAGDWLVLGADDLWWGDDWLTRALDTPNTGFLGFPDGHTDAWYSTHYMATREWLKKYNGGCLAIPVYTTWYIDIETCTRAINSNTYTVADTLVEHRHVVWGAAPDDATYQLRRDKQAADGELYAQRKAAGFPDDFEAVL